MCTLGVLVLFTFHINDVTPIVFWKYKLEHREHHSYGERKKGFGGLGPAAHAQENESGVRMQVRLHYQYKIYISQFSFVRVVDHLRSGGVSAPAETSTCMDDSMLCVFYSQNSREMEAWSHDTVY